MSYRVTVTESKITEYEVIADSEKEAEEKLKDYLDRVRGYGERSMGNLYPPMFTRTRTTYQVEPVE